ncbi:MAG: hypothetical protein ABI282_06225 [Candidatus Baltobacteraceae bacterium]
MNQPAKMKAAATKSNPRRLRVWWLFLLLPLKVIELEIVGTPLLVLGGVFRVRMGHGD